MPACIALYVQGDEKRVMFCTLASSLHPYFCTISCSSPIALGGSARGHRVVFGAHLCSAEVFWFSFALLSTASSHLCSNHPWRLWWFCSSISYYFMWVSRGVLARRCFGWRSHGIGNEEWKKARNAPTSRAMCMRFGLFSACIMLHLHLTLSFMRERYSLQIVTIVKAQ